MCLAVPAKVLSVTGDRAKVASLIGTREVDVRLVRVRPGDFVLVQGGFATERLDAKDAEEILEAWAAAEAGPHA